MMLLAAILGSQSTSGTTPAAPTSGVVDDGADTFNWTYNPSFTSVGNYEYTLNGGDSVATVTAKPLVVGDGDYAAGQVGVRVKSIGGNPASAWLFNATDFTAAGGGSSATLLSATVENANRKRIITTYDALGGGSPPKAGSYATTEGRLVKGNFPAPAAYHAKAIGYGSEIVTGTGNIGAGEDILFYMNKAAHTKVRQSGRLYSIQFYIDTLPGTITGLFFTISEGTAPAAVTSFRTIHMVDILSKVTAGTICTVVFDTPLDVRAGQFTGFGFTSSANLATNVFKSIPSNAAGYLLDGADYITSTPTDPQTWGTNHVDAYIPLTGFMEEAPSVALWGDSLIAGFSGTYGYLDPTVSLTPMGWKFSIAAFIESKLGVGVQNHGWSGQTSLQIKDRLIDSSDGLAVIKATYVICEGGINNVTSDPADTNLIKSHFTAMFDAVIAIGSIPVVAKVWGADPRSNGQMGQMDVLSAWFDTMKATTYPTLVVVDPRAALGQFRSGGAAGNLWDMKPEVQSDSLHLNPLGNERLADAYIAGILTTVPVVKSGNTLLLDVNHDFSDTDVVTITKSGSTLVPAITTPHAVTNNIATEPERLYINGSDIFGTVYDNGDYPYSNGPAGGKFSKKLPANGDGWVATTWYGTVGFRKSGDFANFHANFDVNNPTSLFDMVGYYAGGYSIDYDQGNRAGFGTSPAINPDWFVRTRRTAGLWYIDQGPVMSADPADWTLLGALNPALMAAGDDTDEMFIFFGSAAIQPYGFGLVDV